VAVGLATTTLANNWLNMLRGVAFTAPTGLYVKLHTGDPGAAGTANASAVTTRSTLTLAVASGGAVALTGTQPSWSMTTSETIAYISVWDNASVGNFLWSAQLSVAKTVANGDTLTLTTCGLSLTPLAA
jgi:hypothetical protein